MSSSSSTSSPPPSLPFLQRAIDQTGSGPRAVLFRRLTRPLPDGRVEVRIEAWQEGRRQGVIAQGRAGRWRWRGRLGEGAGEAGRGGGGAGRGSVGEGQTGEQPGEQDPGWDRGWPTAEEARKAVAARLLGEVGQAGRQGETKANPPGEHKANI